MKRPHSAASSSVSAPTALQGQKYQFLTENYSSYRYEVFKNFLRRNTENFVFIPNKGCLVIPGPKKNKYEMPPGSVIAYNSGYILGVGGNPEQSYYYAEWIRKKFRSHKFEAPFDSKRVINVCRRVDLSTGSEVFLEELFDYLTTEFPEWKVVYDPEVAPFMAICRLHGSEEDAEVVGAAHGRPVDARDFVAAREALRSDKRKANSSLHWPNAAAQLEIRQRDAGLRSSRVPFMRCIILLGAKHIIIHRATSKEDVDAAFENFLPVLKHFMGRPENRFRFGC